MLAPFAVNTVHIVDILIPPICVLCIVFVLMHVGHRHFFISLHVLYVYMW